jgi:glycosyltransferase involved in cell wall biosynthesis
LRLLVISSFYPPYEIGGWEQLTEEIVNALRDRGHDVTVLTSDHGDTGAGDGDPQVRRVLALENDQVRYRPDHYFLRRGQNLERNRAHVETTIQECEPDQVLVTTMWNMHRAVPWAAEQAMPDRVSYYLADYWPVEPDVDERFWREQAGRNSTMAWRNHLSSRVLDQLRHQRRQFTPTFSRVAFVSKAVQRRLEASGFPRAGERRVIYNGVDLALFRPAPSTTTARRLIFAGSLAKHKGLDSVLVALSRLNDGECRDIELVVAGDGHPRDCDRIDALTEKLGLAPRITRLGRVDRADVPRLLHSGWAFVLPSVWEEPLARSLQEAMACGLPVVATTSGGTGELVQHGVNGLTYPPGDANALAACLRRLAAAPELAAQLGATARRTVEQSFDVQRTFDEFEDWLSMAEQVAA